MTSILKVSEIQDPTNSNTALTIDSSGNVNIPNKLTVGTIPAVFAQGGYDGDKSIETSDRLGATNDGQAAFRTDGTGGSFIQGSMSYDSATGEFTVPIDGLYHIYGQYYINQPASGRIQIYINDVAIALGHTGPDAQTCAVSTILNLSANDEIEFRNDVGATRTMWEGQNHTFVHIYLIG